MVEAGAFISSPSCDYCYGRIATMADGQRAVATGTLNTPGRMGSVDSETLLHPWLFEEALPPLPMRGRHASG